MSSHKISFYLNEYHIARALATVQRLDPTYKPSSIHQLIKLTSIDYCAKLNIGFSDIIPSSVWTDLKNLMPASNPKTIPSTDAEISNIIYQLEKANNQQTTNQFQNQPSSKPSPQQTTSLIQQPPSASSSALYEDQPTDSIKTTVDDFSFLTSLSNGDFND